MVFKIKVKFENFIMFSKKKNLAEATKVLTTMVLEIWKRTTTSL